MCDIFLLRLIKEVSKVVILYCPASELPSAFEAKMLLPVGVTPSAPRRSTRSLSVSPATQTWSFAPLAQERRDLSTVSGLQICTPYRPKQRPSLTLALMN